MILALAFVIGGIGLVIVVGARALQARESARRPQRVAAHRAYVAGGEWTVPGGRHRATDAHTGTLSAADVRAALQAQADAAQQRMADAVTAEQAAVRADDRAPVR